MIGTIIGAGSVFPSTAPEFTPFCWVRVGQSELFSVMFCRALFVCLFVCVFCPFCLFLAFVLFFFLLWHIQAFMHTPVEQELLTLPEHLSSPPVFRKFRSW